MLLFKTLQTCRAFFRDSKSIFRAWFGAKLAEILGWDEWRPPQIREKNDPYADLRGWSSQAFVDASQHRLIFIAPNKRIKIGNLMGNLIICVSRLKSNDSLRYGQASRHPKSRPLTTNFFWHISTLDFQKTNDSKKSRGQLLPPSRNQATQKHYNLVTSSQIPGLFASANFLRRWKPVLYLICTQVVRLVCALFSRIQDFEQQVRGCSMESVGYHLS